MISNEELIYNKLCEVYPNGHKSITELSRNDTGGRNFIISNEFGFNYDLMHNCSPAYATEHKEKTPDALFFYGSKLYFIEFKEGGSKKPDIRLKIHDGITSLYHFTARNLPQISKDNFVNLAINYAVICRPENTGRNSFINALQHASKRYNLKNIEGFLIDKTVVLEQPQQILQLLNKVTAGRVKGISVFEHLGTTTSVNI
ncbi:hypothetical protein ABEH48_003913 [Yersinia enterocolitica]|uniref:hypothetical protein n=1 Tax=Yersinia kristensenii TaxID=28152 RepID=UPI001C60F4DF|nr:hypothetical protein [Yersinia kristensenii]EKN3567307.1 hypothetical protein [Yersinia enterocolitica]EKN4887479.1 hypothetical protein [Yersinia enterocolitica]EKN4891673.1 hypothetical protein [Yersinia enterocolitica]EKN4904196.1 hypothetical protein [Yersinia enterocolitica]EKN6025313.1 hypothetical protein [Yersinia enterocolitica]